MAICNFPESVAYAAEFPAVYKKAYILSLLQLCINSGVLFLGDCLPWARLDCPPSKKVTKKNYEPCTVFRCHPITTTSPLPPPTTGSTLPTTTTGFSQRAPSEAPPPIKETTTTSNLVTTTLSGDESTRKLPTQTKRREGEARIEVGTELADEGIDLAASGVIESDERIDFNGVTQAPEAGLEETINREGSTFEPDMMHQLAGEDRRGSQTIDFEGRRANFDDSLLSTTTTRNRADGGTRFGESLLSTKKATNEAEAGFATEGRTDIDVPAFTNPDEIDMSGRGATTSNSLCRCHCIGPKANTSPSSKTCMCECEENQEATEATSDSSPTTSSKSTATPPSTTDEPKSSFLAERVIQCAGYICTVETYMARIGKVYLCSDRELCHYEKCKFHYVHNERAEKVNCSGSPDSGSHGWIYGLTASSVISVLTCAAVGFYFRCCCCRDRRRGEAGENQGILDSESDDPIVRRPASREMADLNIERAEEAAGHTRYEEGPEIAGSSVSPGPCPGLPHLDSVGNTMFAETSYRASDTKKPNHAEVPDPALLPCGGEGRRANLASEGGAAQASSAWEEFGETKREDKPELKKRGDTVQLPPEEAEGGAAQASSAWEEFGETKVEDKPELKKREDTTLQLPPEAKKAPEWDWLVNRAYEGAAVEGAGEEDAAGAADEAANKEKIGKGKKKKAGVLFRFGKKTAVF